jgi:UPF0042 nucleotide-binding protein
MKKNKNQKNEEGQTPFVIVTGLSGSGMSSAMKAFEDLGFFCVDNLPVSLLPTFTRLLLPSREGHPSIEKAALVIDIREGRFLSHFPEELAKARKRLEPYVVFFEATDEVLQRRFSETRRPHPADSGSGVLDAIRIERSQLAEVRKEADLIVDTTSHTVHSLRAFLLSRFRKQDEVLKLRVEILSFGHKYGVPTQLDLLFDVRHLPNPYFENELRDLPGTNPRVIEFLDGESEVRETIRRFSELLEYLLPQYEREGKSYLSIGIGCTGGRHRSVRVAEVLKESLAKKDFDVSVNHRDVSK